MGRLTLATLPKPNSIGAVPTSAGDWDTLIDLGRIKVMATQFETEAQPIPEGFLLINPGDRIWAEDTLFLSIVLILGLTFLPFFVRILLSEQDSLYLVFLWLSPYWELQLDFDLPGVGKQTSSFCLKVLPERFNG